MGAQSIRDARDVALIDAVFASLSTGTMSQHFVVLPPRIQAFCPTMWDRSLSAFADDRLRAPPNSRHSSNKARFPRAVIASLSELAVLRGNTLTSIAMRFGGNSTEAAFHLTTPFCQRVLGLSVDCEQNSTIGLENPRLHVVWQHRRYYLPHRYPCNWDVLNNCPAPDLKQLKAELER